jgi:hypothetical protein
MVNKIVLEYLRVNKGNYKIGDLKKKVLSSGYSQKDVDEAMMQLDRETKGNVPAVGATIDKINKTNLTVPTKSEVKNVVGKTQKVSKTGSGKPKKSRKKLWIILGIIALLLIVGGVLAWIFFLKDKFIL